MTSGLCTRCRRPIGWRRFLGSDLCGDCSAEVKAERRAALVEYRALAESLADARTDPTTIGANLPATDLPGRLGWGARLAIAGLLLHAIGFVVLAFGLGSIAQPRIVQWAPLGLVLVLLGLLALGLWKRSHLAYTLGVIFAAYQLLTGIIRPLTGTTLSPAMEVIGTAPALLVLAGLIGARRTYLRSGT